MKEGRRHRVCVRSRTRGWLERWRGRGARVWRGMRCRGWTWMRTGNRHRTSYRSWGGARCRCWFWCRRDMRGRPRLRLRYRLWSWFWSCLLHWLTGSLRRRRWRCYFPLFMLASVFRCVLSSARRNDFLLNRWLVLNKFDICYLRQWSGWNQKEERQNEASK